MTICSALVLLEVALAADVPMPPPPPGMKVSAPAPPPPTALDVPAAAAGSAPLTAPAPAAATPAPTPAAGAKPRLLVSDLAAQGATRDEAAALTDAVVSAISSRALFLVVSSRDLRDMLGAERQRQILGVCADDESACAGSLGTAAGARFVLSGALSRLGATYQLSLQMLDTVKGQPIGRSSRIASDLGVLRAQMPYAVAEATGSPLPPPPPRVLQISMIAAGAALFAGGGFTGMLSLSRQSALNDELCPAGPSGDTCSGVNLRPRSYYLAQNRALSDQKTISLGLMAGGALLAAAGIWLLPPPEGGPRVALGASPSGLLLAGVFP